MDAILALPLLYGLVAVALLFDFLNGLHDAANSIATIVSTRVLRPQYAVLWAAFFNFIAFLFFGLHVAQTISTTHTITGAIVGVGAARRVSAVRWGVAGNIVIAWVVTLPASALVAALTYLATKAFA